MSEIKSGEDLDQLDEIMEFDPDPKEIPSRKWDMIQAGKFSHDEFGDALIEDYHIITVNDRIYIYDNGVYRQDTDIIQNKMIEVFRSIRQTQRSEVLSYIRIKSKIPSDEIKIDPYIVTLKNTRLDLRNGKMISFSPDMIDFARVPVIYDPTAYNADLDKMLRRVFCNNREVLDLFGEMLGYCLMKKCKYGKVFIFFGSGSNGKSTILDLVKTFLGKGNYSSIELDKLTGTFNTAELENKLANIGDDINSGSLRDTGTLKKIFTGDSLQVQRKGERPFDLEPYATHIYSCNELPHFQDKSDGMYRRLALVPFEAKFSRSDPDFDPMIEEKIFTDNALSYLFNLALEGVQRLIRNGGFTEPEIVKNALENFKTANSTALSWISSEDLKEEYLLSRPKKVLYAEFKNWCTASGVHYPPSMKGFESDIRDAFGFKSCQARVPGEYDSRAMFFVKV